MFLAGLEEDATDLAAMLNGVPRLAGLSDRSESSLLGVMVTWLLKNKLNYLILSPIATLTLNMCWGRRLPSSEKLVKPCRTLRNLLRMLCTVVFLSHILT